MINIAELGCFYGFYYDFDAPRPITEADFEPITARMEEIIKSGEEFTREEISREDALARFAGEPYKAELISELPEGETITLYNTGNDFFDLCRGPHVVTSKELMAWGFQLMSVTGAYWRGGDEKCPMLQRIYAYAFPDKKALKAYIIEREEAKKRDHNKLGRERPYVIHRTSLGCYERTLALLIEKYAGAAPHVAYERTGSRYADNRPSVRSGAGAVPKAQESGNQSGLRQPQRKDRIQNPRGAS